MMEHEADLVLAILVGGDILPGRTAAHENLDPLFLSQDFPAGPYSQGHFLSNRAQLRQSDRFRDRFHLSMLPYSRGLDLLGWFIRWTMQRRTPPIVDTGRGQYSFRYAHDDLTWGNLGSLPHRLCH